MAKFVPYRFPFFRVAGQTKLAAKQAALQQLEEDATHQVNALMAQIPHMERVFRNLLDPTVDMATPMAELEQWWDRTYRNKSILRLLALPRENTRTKILKRYFFPPQGDVDTDLPEIEVTAGLPEVITTLSRLALLLGAAIMARRPDYRWVIHPSAPGRSGSPIGAGRIVIMKQPGSQFYGFWIDPFYNLCDSYCARADPHYRKTICVEGQWVSQFAGWEFVNLVWSWQDS